MAKKKQVSEQSLDELKDQLRDSPELFDRISEIVQLSSASGLSAGMNFDEFESELVPKVSALGRQAGADWIGQIEQQQAAALKASDPSVKQREKKR